jgi:anti-sigma B factor antagonist
MVSVTKQDTLTTVELEGSIDGKTAPQVREEMRPALEGATEAILDMSKVGYLSSAGLRLLLLVYREFTAKQGKLVLVGVAPDIQAVMSHTGFLNFFTIVDTQAAALQALGRGN